MDFDAKICCAGMVDAYKKEYIVVGWNLKNLKEPLCFGFQPEGHNMFQKIAHCPFCGENLNCDDTEGLEGIGIISKLDDQD